MSGADSAVSRWVAILWPFHSVSVLISFTLETAGRMWRREAVINLVEKGAARLLFVLSAPTFPYCGHKAVPSQ